MRKWSGGALALIIFTLLGLQHAEGRPTPTIARPVPLVMPSADHTKLLLQDEGLQVLNDLEGAVAIVGVIGPYRSGKSFLLNQLLNLECDKGRRVLTAA